MKKYQWFIFLTVILSIISLFLGQIPDRSYALLIFSSVIDILLIAVVLAETVYGIAIARYKRIYLRENIFPLLFTLTFFVLFIYSKFFYTAIILSDLAIFAILLRNVFVVLKIYGKNKISAYVEKFTANPSQSILLSFVFVILAGTLLLMMNFATVDGRGLPFFDALFTATSATCVNGLIVVDTATTYTIWGQLVLLVLIQIGGLGIMLLTFFTIFLLGRRMSLKDKMLLSYMLSEDDNSSLRSTVLGIVFTTFLIEGIGALLLFWGFLPTLGFSIKNAYYSIFHAVSAFCNAGFVLYSDGFESFRLNPVVNFTIAFLIILGGISFAVIHNVRLVLKERFTALAKRQRGSFQNDLTLNSRIVLVFAGVLILAGTLLFYILEHDNSMASYGLGEQYLAAFFQSVTLRTAGFNTVPFSNFTVSTYLFMCVFMFIGASSGGTAGGIKVQTVAVIGSAIRSFLRGEKTATIQNYQIGNDKIRSAFVICLSGLTAVFVAVFVLSLTEKADVLKIMFEVCAAIGTTGISAGITSSLSVTGKIAILLLMFWGRLGAITILSAAAFDKEQVNISYPQADISIG